MEKIFIRMCHNCSKGLLKRKDAGKNGLFCSLSVEKRLNAFKQAAAAAQG